MAFRPMLRRFRGGTFFVLLTVFGCGLLFAQTKPVEGLHDERPSVHALTNATIVQAPGRVIENGTVIIRDGIIENVGKNVSIPADARQWDYSGKMIYAGLIDVYAETKAADKGKGSDKKSGSAAAPSYWNDRVHPEKSVLELYSASGKDLASSRKMGFTSAWLVPAKGIFRGSSAVVTLGDGDIHERILNRDVAQHLAFESGGGRYPGSLMGSIALIRQTLYDAQWYGGATSAYAASSAGLPPEANDALAALQSVINGRQLLVTAIGNDLDLLRVMKLRDEFGFKPMLKGSGHEYRQLETLKKSRAVVILPLNFPHDIDLTAPENAINVSLMHLQHWEQAPHNPARLAAAGIPFALTRSGLDKKQNFHKQIQKAIEHGLSADDALAALTTTPAKILGVGSALGTIEKGKRAHLLVTSKALFEKGSDKLDLWIDGKRYELKKPSTDISGKWDLRMNQHDGVTRTIPLEITGTDKPKVTLLKGDHKVKADKASISNKRLTLLFAGDSLDMSGKIRLSGSIRDGSMHGAGELADGTAFLWEATFKETMADKKSEKKEAAKAEDKMGDIPIVYHGAFGRSGKPQMQKHILVKNATIWTSGPDGILEDADMLISNGKIAKIRAGLYAPGGATVIDAKGKHVTPGLIDAHSHSGIERGVNESQQAVTSEVRIGDVINSYSIAFYRELAGGLTASNLLHGSANPIGGQNAVIKLRWGSLPEEMKIAGAPEGIKFALGENVKQANWGDKFTTRYPQTRMGVETIIRDRFQAAREYRDAWQKYNAGKKKKGVAAPRRDLELEALVEILEGKRLIHCHSYRQDEILMLTRVAQEFGFKIATFQHVLEGYKVAEELSKLDFGASTFSDWWAYKFEVYDAIPHNGALMHDVGVNVSFNSDSNELARRMNTEAAKAVRYGGVAPVDALKFVTINPAYQLGIDKQVGSLEVGKDGDFVVWSGDPLSTYTMCEQTWIEGAKYFDRQDDIAMRDEIRTERARLIQKYLATGDGSGGGKGMKGSSGRIYDSHHSCRDHGDHDHGGHGDDGHHDHDEHQDHGHGTLNEVRR